MRFKLLLLSFYVVLSGTLVGQECKKIIKQKKGITYLRASKTLYTGTCIHIDRKSSTKSGQSSYKNGMLDGTEIWFYEDGAVKIEIDFKEGMKEGFWKHYSPEGLLTESVEYHKGKAHGRHTLYYETGKARLQRNFEEGVLNGHYIEYFEEGGINNECMYKNGLKEGLYRSYYPDGAIQSEYTFIHDKIDGVYRFFDVEGNVIYLWMYINGVKTAM